MLKINVSTAEAVITETELITSGRKGLRCAFTFSDDWAGLAKTVIVQGAATRDIALLATNEITVPAECVNKAQFPLKIGVYGARPDGTIAIPTIWASFGKVLPGAKPSDIPPDELTPDVVAQIQEAANNALYLARNVQSLADSGALDGVSPAVTVTSITGGHNIKITDRDHPDGQDFDVPDGQDGVSPSLSSTAITGGHRVSMTDRDGTTTFDVMDGVGVPSGGTTGQFLRKASNDDHDTIWETVQTDRFDKELVILTPAVGSTAYTWTNGTAWSSSGRNTNSSLSTRSGKKSISPGAIVQNKSAASVNGKSLYVHVVEWAGDTFVRRTYLQTGKYVTIGSTTDTYALNFAYDSGQSAPNMDAATLAANFAVRVIDKEIPRKTSELTNDAGFVTHGIPAGGSSGQVLKKASGTDYDTVWANESGGGGGSISPYTSNPAALGTASPGVSDDYARGDHVHPLPPIPDGADEITWTGGNLGQTTPPSNVEQAVGVVYNAIPTTASDVGAVAVAQGVAHAGEFVVVGSDGNITTVTMSVWQGGSY